MDFNFFDDAMSAVGLGPIYIGFDTPKQQGMYIEIQKKDGTIDAGWLSLSQVTSDELAALMVDRESVLVMPGVPAWIPVKPPRPQPR